MIRRVVGYVASDGNMYWSREDACKAEFHRLLKAKFKAEGKRTVDPATLASWLFDIDKMCGQACAEDTSFKGV